MIRQVVRFSVLLLACGAVQLQGQQSNLNSSRTTTQPKAVVPATTDPSYVIGPEDVLLVSVWKEPDMTLTVPVRPDGKISFPLLNDVQAAGLTPMQMTEDLTTRLKKYLENPQVTVIVTATNSRRVFIVGQVGHAGAIPLLPEMTVLQALSSAGGVSQYGNEKGIYVLRHEPSGEVKKIAFNYKEVIKGVKSEQNIVLKPGDTIVVP
jgi:polysaccharide biosynthesis/export protein